MHCVIASGSMHHSATLGFRTQCNELTLLGTDPAPPQGRPSLMSAPGADACGLLLLRGAPEPGSFALAFDGRIVDAVAWAFDEPAGARLWGGCPAIVCRHSSRLLATGCLCSSTCPVKLRWECWSKKHLQLMLHLTSGWCMLMITLPMQCARALPGTCSVC